MPAHNVADFIGLAIESVLKQSHTNLQLIVVDDDSSDSSATIVEGFVSSDSRITLIRLDAQSGGPSKPRNTALQNIDGAFVAFLDADDVWHSDKLKYQLELMHVHKLDFTSTRHIKFIDAIDNTQVKLSSTETPQVSIISHQQMLRKNRIVCSGVMLSVSYAKQLEFSENEYVGVEDYLAWLKLLEDPSIRAAIVNAPLVFYRLRSDSLSNSKFKMAKKIYSLLSSYSPNGQRLGIKKYLYFGYYVVAGSTIFILDKLRMANKQRENS